MAAAEAAAVLAVALEPPLPNRAAALRDARKREAKGATHSAGLRGSAGACTGNAHRLESAQRSSSWLRTGSGRPGGSGTASLCAGGPSEDATYVPWRRESCGIRRIALWRVALRRAAAEGLARGQPTHASGDWSTGPWRQRERSARFLETASASWRKRCRYTLGTAPPLLGLFRAGIGRCCYACSSACAGEGPLLSRQRNRSGLSPQRLSCALSRRRPRLRSPLPRLQAVGVPRRARPPRSARVSLSLAPSR